MLLLVPCLSTHINLPVFKKCPSFRMRSCCVVHATDQLMRRLCIVQCYDALLALSAVRRRCESSSIIDVLELLLPKPAQIL